MDKYMYTALKEANKAAENGDVPVGAVIVKNGKILAKAYNKKQANMNAVRHAEIIAIEKACKKEKSWRLCDCTIFVTLEPCIMCFGAILNARIDKLVFGAYSGTDFSDKYCKAENNALNHNLEITGGVEEEKCVKILGDFFSEKRKK